MREEDGAIELEDLLVEITTGMDAAMKLKAQVSSLEAALKKAQTGMVLSIRQNFHNIDLP